MVKTEMDQQILARILYLNSGERGRRSMLKFKLAMFRRVIATLLPLALVACSDPATPPAPPAELPSALQFPESIGISVDTIQTESSETEGAALVGAGGTFSDDIAMGANDAEGVSDMIDEILQRFNDMEIPVSETTLTFEETITVPLEPFDPDSSTITAGIKIDFSDFDLDDDGATEGCSGHTAATPICGRLWFNEKRLMAFVFTEFPTDETVGAGRFRIASAQSSDRTEIAGEDFLMAAIYDHSDPENKETEMFGIGQTRGGEGGIATYFRGHISLTQVGPDASALKTINMTSAFGETPDTPNSFQYIGQWKEDADFWNGSVEIQVDGSTDSFSNACASISSGNAATGCLAAGLDITGLSFNSEATEDNVGLPSDFPETPTF